MKVYFTPRQSVDDNPCFSPSAGKPAKFVAELGLTRPGAEIVRPRPVDRVAIERVHDAEYVDDVLSCRRSNGFGNRSGEIAAALPFVLGSHLAAARAAVDGERITCSPTSGFHHAELGSGDGFCTFNGLMVSAAALRAEERARKVAVLDCDVHYGNGTEDIKRQRGMDWVWTQGRILERPASGEAYLAALARLLDEIEGLQPDLVRYQAGADPHVDDPLGGVLSTEQMRLRDRLVFERLCRDRRIPLVWNLAGGYQRDADGGISAVLALHVNTYDEAERVYRELQGA